MLLLRVVVDVVVGCAVCTVENDCVNVIVYVVDFMLM